MVIRRVAARLPSAVLASCPSSRPAYPLSSPPISFIGELGHQMLQQILALLILVLLVLLGVANLQRQLSVAAPNQPTTKETPAKTRRLLCPRSSEDSPPCYAAPGVPSSCSRRLYTRTAAARSQKPPRRTQTDQDRGPRLPQPGVRLSRRHQCPTPCLGRRCSSWPRGTDSRPILSRLSTQIHGAAGDSALSAQDLGCARGLDLDRAGRRALGSRCGCRAAASLVHPKSANAPRAVG
jgi:hypothetical protein